MALPMFSALGAKFTLVLKLHSGINIWSDMKTKLLLISCVLDGRLIFILRCFQFQPSVITHLQLQ